MDENNGNIGDPLKKPLDKFLNKYNSLNSKKIKILVSLSGIGMLLFLAVATVFPFKDQLLSRLYPKPSSFAQTVDSANPSGRELDYTQIQPLSAIKTSQPLSAKPIYNYSISGQVYFKNSDSFVRVILIDDQNNEYLVYEAYPLVSDSNNFTITDACEETCFLNGVNPVSLRLEGNTSSLNITNSSFSSVLPMGVSKVDIINKAVTVKAEKDNSRISKLINDANQKKIQWIVGETPISKMTYAQKKKLFTTLDNKPVDHLPNLQGFEYYKGGVFDLRQNANIITNPQEVAKLTSSSLPRKWDWRNVHGENWNTSVKSQGAAGTCSAFSIVGALESAINLYFNQHIDVDLSEQMYTDCVTSSTPSLGMSPNQYPECLITCSPGNGYCAIKNHGLATEQCDPYVGRDFGNSLNCNTTNICSDWQQKSWTISDFHDYRFADYSSCPKETAYTSEDELKKLLITKGPSASLYIPWPHAMVLVGYEIDLYNETVWIYKNSWGTGFGENGYVKIKTSPTDIVVAGYPLVPIPPPNQSYNIACVDKDNDGYCNWGISESKPATCPSFCKAEKDCNDADPNMGPFDSNYNCVLLNGVTPMPTPTSFICPSPVCDFNKDGEENSLDGDALRACVFKPITTPGCTTADVNCDGTITILDIQKFSYQCPQDFTTPTPLPNKINIDTSIQVTDKVQVY